MVVAGLSVRVISAHLDPGHVDIHEYYWNDLLDLENLICTIPRNFVPVLGVDAQDAVGPSGGDTSGIIGDHTSGQRHAKGDMFVAFCGTNGLKLWNKFFVDPASVFTCYHFGRTEATQMDFLASPFGKRRVKDCRTLESSATISDHKPVVLTLHAAGHVPRFVGIATGPRKPIGWRLEQFEFNDHIRNHLHMEGPGENDLDNFVGHHVYTDGSYLASSRKVAKAGWGFAVFDRGPEPDDDQSLLHEAFGLVVVDANSSYFVGAGKKSNNTAEMSAIIEVMMFLLADCQCKGPLGCSSIIIHSDSTYAIGAATGKFRPRENIGMGILVRHLFVLLRCYCRVHLHWVKGHHGNL